MNISNAGLAFNKTVFKDLADNKTAYRAATKDLHQKLFALKLDNKAVESLTIKKEEVEGNGRTFFASDKFIVAWPGLMMGLGYGHGAKTTTTTEENRNLKLHPHEMEVKTGFYFDFTSGLPVLPGSIVKGILRSYFPGRYKHSVELKRAVTERLLHILNAEGKFRKTDNTDWTTADITELEQAIFEGKSIPSTEQDIFFDAFPCKGVDAKVFNTNEPEAVTDVFLGEDVLTPHDHPLHNPVPIKHLKILPGVTMRFQFLLNDKGGLSADQKHELFIHLLTEFGAGARKGTGFGQFVKVDSQKSGGQNALDWGIPFAKLECDDSIYDKMATKQKAALDSSRKKFKGSRREEFETKSKIDRLMEQTKPGAQPRKLEVKEDKTWVAAHTLKNGEMIACTVVRAKEGGGVARLHITGYEFERPVSGKLNVGDIIERKITNISLNKEGRLSDIAISAT